MLPLALRFRTLRRKHVTTTCLNPKCKPRHETINLSLYTSQTETSYVDFFEDIWWVAGGPFWCFQFILIAEGVPLDSIWTWRLIPRRFFLAGSSMRIINSCACRRRDSGCQFPSIGTSMLQSTWRARGKHWRRKRVGLQRNLGCNSGEQPNNHWCHCWSLAMMRVRVMGIIFPVALIQRYIFGCRMLMIWLKYDYDDYLYWIN